MVQQICKNMYNMCVWSFTVIYKNIYKYIYIYMYMDNNGR